MLIFKSVITLFFLFFFSVGFSQEITGIVMDGETNKPLEGTSIYFDNTTIGTVTNPKGEFTLDFNKDIKTPLVISFVGYETRIMYEFSTIEKLKIYIYESRSALGEVVINSVEGWSRELKLSEFRKHYLGESKNGESCSILNEENIILRYDKNKRQLTAKSNTPIFIKNNNLNYFISVDLLYFEVNYYHVSKNKKRLSVYNVYYSGSNFYKSLQNNPTKSTLKTRQETYFGSTLHFMRSLASDRLREEGYKIYLGSTQITPKKYITITPMNNVFNVKVKLRERLNIMFKNEKQSSIESLVPEFYIDNFGNHSPLEEVRFGGDLGRQRMGDALPLDFLLTKYRRTENI